MVNINSIDFTDDHHATGAIYLNGSISDKIKATIEIGISWNTLNTEFSFLAASKTITRSDTLTLGVGSFIDDGFTVGDNITIIGTASNDGNLTIASLTTNVITVVEVLINEALVIANIHGVTLIKSIDFKYNLLGTGESNTFLNRIDGTEQKLTAINLDTTAAGSESLLPLGNIKSWVTGDVTEIATESNIFETGFSGFKQTFRIEHTFFTEPSTLPDQIDVDSNTIITENVDYLLGTSTLRYHFQVDARFNNNDPNVRHSTSDEGSNIDQFLSEGNVGGYDTLLNGQPSDYSVSTIAYTETNSGDVVSGILSNSKTDVSVTLASASGAFTTASGGNPIIIDVRKVITDIDDISNTSTTFWENYQVSKVKIFTGGAAGSSDNLIDAGALAPFINATTLTVTFTVDATSGKIDDKYSIAISVSDPAITDSDNTDRVNVLCDLSDVQEFSELNGVMTIIGGVKMNEHSSNDVSLSSNDYKGWIEDGVLATSRIRILKEKLQTGGLFRDIYVPTNIIVRIEAEHITDELRDFILEEKIFTIGIDADVERDFKLSAANPKNRIRFIEDKASETATERFWDLEYAFKIRFEDWQQLNNSDFDFTNAKQKWDVFNNAADWELKYNIYSEIEQTSEEVTGCDWIINTTSESSWGVKITKIITGLPVFNFDMDDGNILNTNNVIHQYALGSGLKTICVNIDDQSNVSSINFGRSLIVNEIDFTIFTAITEIIVNNNFDLTKIILATTNSVSRLSSIGNNLSNGISLGTTNNSMLARRFNLTGSLKLTSLTLPTSATGSYDNILIDKCSLLTVVDLSNVSVKIDLITVSFNPLLATLTLSTGAIETLQAQSNSLLKFIDFSTLTDINDINLADNGLTVSEVNCQLENIDSTGILSGTLTIDGTNAAPDGSGGGCNGITAKANLIANGWTVITN